MPENVKRRRKGKHHDKNLGPSDDPEYHPNYNKSARRENNKKKKRKSKSKANSAIAMNLNHIKAADVLDDLMDELARDPTNRGLHRKVEEWTTWKMAMRFKDRMHGLTTDSTGVLQEKEEGEEDVYELWANKWYGQGDCGENMVCILVVKKSLLPDAGYGAFAGRQFEKHETVGIYLGAKERKTKGEKKHSDYRYLLSGVADAQGGVGSGKPFLLGMHFVNDPEYVTDDDESDGTKRTRKAKKDGKRKRVPKANVAFYTDGRVVALRRILKGEEFYVLYKKILNV